jgi:deoxyadenosine/deoxycytidine kinase
MPIISIEGNIGAGKSTLLEKIQQRVIQTNNKKIHIIPESLDVWTSIKDGKKSILELYYNHKKKYAVPFQVLTFLSMTFNMMGEIQRLGKDDIVIIERSPISNIAVFAQMLYDEKIIGEVEWSVLKFMANGLMMPVDTIVYLQTDPVDCLERVRYRNRLGEDTITLSYLEKVHDQHEHWLKEVPHQTLQTQDEQQMFIDRLFSNDI